MDTTLNTTQAADFAALDITLVDAGPEASGYATATDDGCGSGNTGSTACTGGK